MEKRYNNTSTRKNQMGKNGVRDVNWRWIHFFAGFLLALALPFLIDLALFGNPMPCQTEKVYEDGSSIQKCEVRR